MRTETAQRFLDDALDESSPIGKAAISRLALGLGADLGFFYAPWPECLAFIAHQVSPYQQEKKPLGEGARALSGLAIGFGAASGAYEETHEVSQDAVPAFAVAVGERLGVLDIEGARSECRTAPREMTVSVKVVGLVVQAFEASVMARARELFLATERDDEAVAMALLIEPMRPEDLARLVFGPELKPDEMGAKLEVALKDCLKGDFVTLDGERIRDEYQAPLADGLIALTAVGRRHLSTLGRPKRVTV